MRAEAPPCGGSQNSPRWLRHENISCTTIKTENRLRPAQHCKLQKTISEKNDCKQRKPTNCKTAKKQRSNNRKQTTIPNPPAPLRRQRTAESTNHADANHDPHHSGCEVAGSEDKTKIIDAKKSIKYKTTAQKERWLSDCMSESQRQHPSERHQSPEPTESAGAGLSPTSTRFSSEMPSDR